MTQSMKEKLPFHFSGIKIGSLLLLISLILSVSTVTFAANNKYHNEDIYPGIEKDGIYYNGNEGIVEIAGFSYDMAGEVTIPDSFQDRRVTYINMEAFSGTNITEINIPSTINMIYTWCFQGATHLTEINVDNENTVYSSVDGVLFNKDKTKLIAYPQGRQGAYTIPNGVSAIGYGAFSGCSGLTEITIPESVTTMGSDIFRGCDNLTAINAGEGDDNLNYSSEDGVLFNKDKTELIAYPQGKQGAYNIPDGVTAIREGAFSGSRGLTEISLPDGITEIKMGVFYDSSSLTSVTIPSSVTRIEFSTFRGCTALNEINVDSNNPLYYSDDGVVFYKGKEEGKIEHLVLYPSGRQGEYVIPDGIESMESNAFVNCTGLTEITIPNSVTSLGSFKGCTALTKISIPDSVMNLGGYGLVENPFTDCAALTEIVIADNNQSYSSDDGVLYNKNKTELIACPQGKQGAYNIPDGVITIRDRAFNGCSGLTEITIPESVTAIGKYAFEGCSGLTEIIIPDDITTIEQYAFSGCSGLTEIIIPDDVTAIWSGAFSDCTALTSVTFADNLKYIANFAFEGCTSLSSISIPDSVKEIQDGTFKNCTALNAVIIPDSITSIGSEAFANCSSLSSITIPDEVTKIDTRAFINCTGLTSLSVPDSVNYIGTEAFAGCAGLTSVVVPDSIVTLSKYAFLNCIKLKSVAIVNEESKMTPRMQNSYVSLSSDTGSNPVATIGYGAFAGCTDLNSVTITNKTAKIEWCAFLDYANLTICGYSGSTAETYAKENDIPFSAISEIVSVTGVSLNKTVLDLKLKEKATLKATVEPANATNKVVQWKSDNTNVATVNNSGEITAVAPGIAVITAQAADSDKAVNCKIFVRKEVQTFVDVPAEEWYTKVVYDLAELDILSGKGGGQFDPQGLVTRGEFAKILAFAAYTETELKNKYDYASPFADCVKHWSRININWAKENDIVKGTTLTTFEPDANITREQMAAMINDYAAYKGIDLPKKNDLKSFADDAKIADYSKNSVYAMQQAGIIYGKENNRFDPQGKATRAEAAAMVSRLLYL